MFGVPVSLILDHYSLCRVPSRIGAPWPNTLCGTGKAGYVWWKAVTSTHNKNP